MYYAPARTWRESWCRSGASNFPLGAKNILNGVDIPVSWINSKYRMVYFDCGQGDRIYSTPVLPMMIDNSLRFLLDAAK